MTFSLKEHLKRYGIYEMNKDKYWTWSGKKLSERKIKRLNSLREPIVKGCDWLFKLATVPVVLYKLTSNNVPSTYNFEPVIASTSL